jgi:chorismate dehydratase
MLRLGRVAFINTFPVEWALPRHLDPDEVEEVAAVPTELNRMLAARELDVANVSSVEYADNPERYVLLPSLCVGSDGAVESVQLITQLPLPAVHSIAVTSQSATSVALVRLLAEVEGTTAIEYGMIAAGIAIAIIVVVNTLGQTVLTSEFQALTSAMTP